MMCLLTTAGASSTAGSSGQNGSNYASAYDAMDSPPSSESSENSKSPPQLSPQEGNLFVDLHTTTNESASLFSPQMALLTPQIKESSDPAEKVVTSMTPEPDDHDHELQAEEKRKTVPFTFCNMRQNIFDLKKKRGRKLGSQNKKTSLLAPAPAELPLETTTQPETAIIPQQKPCPLRKRKNLTSYDHFDLGSKSPKTDVDFEDEIVMDESDAEDDPFNDSKEIVEDVVDGLLSSIFEPASPRPKIQKLRSLVPLTDLFQKTPLSSFSCFGCSKIYSNQDTYCVDLKCQTLLLTCSQCHWWTNRRVDFSHDPVFCHQET